MWPYCVVPEAGTGRQVQVTCCVDGVAAQRFLSVLDRRSMQGFCEELASFVKHGLTQPCAGRVGTFGVVNEMVVELVQARRTLLAERQERRPQ